MLTDSENLALRWRTAGTALGFEVVAPSRVMLGALAINVPVRVPHFGAPNGMLIFPSYELLAPYERAILDHGYGYSVIAASWPPDPFEAGEFVAVLKDWGWSGFHALAPAWLGET